MNSGKGRLIVISAPSGAGKSTVINRLLEIRPELALSVSATTRQPRAGEVDGVAYHFVSRDKFRDMINDGEFLEYAEYVGEFYGTPIKPIREHTGAGRDVLLEIEVQGAKQIMELEPDAVTIFLTVPGVEELERRLRVRGTDSEEKLSARMEQALLEFPEQSSYKHIVVNDDVDRAAEEIDEIISRKD